MVLVALVLELGAECVAGGWAVLGAVSGPVATVFACASCEAYEQVALALVGCEGFAVSVAHGVECS